MRSARILFAATAAAGTLALAAPGAYAAATGDWDKDSSSHSQKHDKPKGGVHTGSGALSLVGEDHWDKDKHHDKPKGGMHTGSGALSVVSADDWSKDKEKKDKEKEHGYGHDKPKGGMHTGSGALSVVNADDWSKEKDEEKDKEKDTGKEHGYGHDKPKGGMHTGGGGLAGSGTNVTGAVVLAGGLAAFVAYRRRKAAGTAA